MKRLLLGLVVVAVFGGALTASSAPAPSPTATKAKTSVSPFLPSPPFGPRQDVFFGSARSLVRKGAHYELRIDPAFSLTGVTAQRAAVEDGVLGPGEPVPNDYYIRNESRRLYTYLVPPTARVTVLTNPGTGPRSTRITVAELSRILRGKNPRNRPLFGPSFEVWVRVAGDTVISLDQNYRP